MHLDIISHRTWRLAIAAAAMIATLAVSPAFGAPPGEEDHEELRELLRLIAKAHNEGDFQMLAPFLAEPFVFTSSDQLTFTSLDEIEKHYTEVFDSEDSPLTSLHVEPAATIKTQFIDDNNGYCYGTVLETYTLRSGEEIKLTASWTGTVTRVGGTWKVSTAHVGIHFMENAVVDIVKATIIKWVLIGGLVGGLVIGSVVTILLGRRKRRHAASAG